MTTRRAMIGAGALAATGFGLGTAAEARAPIRVGIIGRTGRGDYGHDLDTVWLDIPEAKIAAVADENGPGRQKAVARLGASMAYADYREMLRKERPEYVSICPRWIDCHEAMLLACAESGVRGVLMEKPLCRSLEEADRMVAAAERARMKVAVCHQTRYSPRVARVKEMIARGALGDLVEIRARGKEDRRGGGEDLIVLGTHTFDLMRFFGGDPKWCFASVSQNGRPVRREDARQGAEGLGLLAGDTLHATFGFEGPLTGSFGSHVARAFPSQRYGTHVFGTKGVVSIGHGPLPPVYWLDDPSWSLFQNGGTWVPVSSEGPGKPEPLSDSSMRWGNRLIVRDLLAAVREDRQPAGSILDGRAALEMILAVYESHLAGRPVSFPLPKRKHPLE